MSVLRFTVALLFLVLPSVTALAEEKGRGLCQKVFESSGEDYQLAIIDIAENRWPKARERVEKGAFSDDQKLLLWRLMVGREKKITAKDLAAFQFAPETLKEIITDLAATDPATCLSLLPKGYSSPDELFSTLQLLAGKIDIAPVLDRIGVLSEAERAELAVQQIQGFGENAFLNHQAAYAVSGTESLVNVLEALFRRAWYEPERLAALGKIEGRFSPENRARLLIALAESKMILSDWDKFESAAQALEAGKLSLPSQTEIAGAVFATWTNEHGWDLEYFQSLFEDQGYQIPFTYRSSHATDVLVATFQRVNRDQIRNREKRDEFLFAAYGKRAIAMSIGVEKLKRAIFRLDGDQTIAATFNLESLENLHLADPAAHHDLTRVLQTFAEENPELLPKEFVSVLWDPVRNQSVALRMLQEYLYQNRGNWDHVPANSLEVLAYVSGLSYSDLRTSRLTKNPGELYTILLDIQDGMSAPAFKDLRVDPSAFEARREFLNFLRALRDLHALNGDHTEGWEKTLGQTGLTRETPLTSDNLAEFHRAATENLVRGVQEKLTSYGIRSTYDQFVKLEAQWGDLEPLWTLLSRFESEPNWRGEIPALAQVFESSLDGTFRTRKFEGGFTLPGRPPEHDIHMAAAQFASVAPEKAQRAAWVKPRWKIAIPEADSERGTKSPEVLESVRSELLAKVEGSLLQTAKPGKISQKTARELEALLEGDLLHQDPHPIVEKLLTSLLKANGSQREMAGRALLAAALDHLKSPTSTPERLRGTVRLLRSLVTTERGLAAADPQAVKLGLSQAERALRDLEQKTAGEILLTVLNGDPKFLITIGDAVKTSSCQSYSTGGRIDALLGYVMDANVQAVVSYSLSQQQFENAGDFHCVVKARLEKRLGKVEFDGNKKIATFTIRGAAAGEKSVKVVSLPLENAYQRQMIKLGRNTRTQQPGLRLEALYEQQHLHSDRMQAMHEEILEDLVREMGIEENESPIAVSGSRNPGGVYSDLAQTQTNEPYVIP